MRLQAARARLRQKLRAHLLDALDARGLVRASRLVILKPGVCELRPFEESLPGSGEILVETEVSLISPGTERAVFSGRSVAAEYPYVPGYSQAGRIVATGDGSALQVGQRVSTGAPHASLYLCPADRAFVVPRGVASELAAVAQIGAIALQGVRKAGIEPGARVVVLGCGLIGQLAAQLARCCGADVMAVATSPARLAVARQCGLRTLNLGEDPKALGELDGEIVIEATGDPQAINAAIRAARPGARVVLLGSSRGVTRGAELATWQGKGLIVVGAHVAALPTLDPAARTWTWRREVESFLELTRQQRLRLEPLLTRRVTPDEAPLALADLACPEDKSIGVLIEWARPGPWRARVERASPLRAAATLLRHAAGRSTPRESSFLARRSDGRSLRFGLIGCGEIAAESAAALRAASNATISFSADPDLSLAESLAAATGARATSDVRELLESSEVDAVLVSTPHHLHAPLAIQAAEAGKHVVVEKPMATSVSDCDRMIAAARHAGVTLSVCYCHRYDPRVQRARHLLEAGAIGEILGVRIVLGQYRGPAYWKRGLSGRTLSDWRGRRETAGGGVLIMNACHLLDFMCWLVGSEVVEVAACAATQGGADVEDTISVSYRHANGAIGTLDATNSLVGPSAFEQSLRGSEGQLVVSPALRFWSRRTIEGYTAGRWHVIRGLPRSAERRHYFEAFAAAVLDGGRPPVTAEEARDVQAVLEAAYLSAENKRTVTVDRLGAAAVQPAG